MHVHTVDTSIISCRLIKEVTRVCMRAANSRVTAAYISDKRYEKGEYIKCPLCWTKGVLEALHEASEYYMVDLLEDAYLIAIHARRITLQPSREELVQHRFH